MTFYLYTAGWFLLFFTLLNPQLNTYIRAFGLGVAVAGIITLSLILYARIIGK